MAYIPSSKEEEQFLKDFDPSKYKNPAVAADTALFAIDGELIKILLIKRGGYPYKGCWALPGGFVNIDEDLKAAAARELLEETGITVPYLEQAFVWGNPGRDPRQRVITISFITLAEFSRLSAKAGDDAAQAEWFTIKDYIKSDKGDMTEISYTLEGPETLHPVVRFPSGRMQLIERIESSGLAFDHAESFAYSFEYLKQRAAEDFLDIALENPIARRLAIMALGHN